MLPLRHRFLCIVSAAVALTVGATPLDAQEAWVGPQPPCNLKEGDRLVTDGMIHLKVAVETEFPDQREARLDQAFEVLTRAIHTRNQADNPAAWYYLGRYFAYRENAVGADSSFRKTVELAPECVDDVAQHAAQLQPTALAQAFQAWQEGRQGAAIDAFHIARRLNPKDANAPFLMSEMYSSTGQLDSAGAYLSIANELAGDDPGFERRRQRAILELARAYEARGAGEPALRSIDAIRVRRDSAQRAIRRDATMLTELIAEWAGKNLRPEVQQAVQRDSTTLENRIAAARTVLQEAIVALQTDSTAVAVALGPALAAYRDYFEAFPGDVATALRVLRVASNAGDAAMMDFLIELVARAEDVNTDNVVQTAVSLFNGGHLWETSRLLDVALGRNPYHRTALLLSARTHYTQGDVEQSMAGAKRLMEIDPLNQQTARMMALAWDLSGQRDSARAYIELANRGIRWAVNVTQFVPTESASILNGNVTNIAGEPLPPTTVEIEFLDAQGNVVSSASVDVPALEPGGQHAVALRVAQGGAVAWRYRRR